MTEYRIVRKWGVYRIQYRFLYFFWRFYEESVWEESNTLCSDRSYYAPYEVLCDVEAKEKLLQLSMKVEKKKDKWIVVDIK